MAKFTREGITYECIHVPHGAKITVKENGKDVKIPALDWFVTGPDGVGFAVKQKDFASTFKLV